VRLFAAVMARRQQHGVGPVPQMDREYDRVLPILRQHLGESTFAQGWAEGQAMDFEDIVAYALEITRDAALAGPVTPSRAPASSADDELARLTPREREIATLVARGLANREIAESLTVAQRTVETHVHNILGKLELTSRGQLAFWAIEHGLVAPGSHERSARPP
jgi:non-specific serine/threonine protein kinase